MKYRTADCSEIVRGYLRYRSMQELANGSPNPEALLRRLHDIVHCKTQQVSLRVMDEIATAAGHPEWLQLLEPV